MFYFVFALCWLPPVQRIFFIVKQFNIVNTFFHITNKLNLYNNLKTT